MRRNLHRIIATAAVFTLLAAGAAAADEQGDEASAAAHLDTVRLHRHRAASAHTAAVEDAIEAVLAANKRRLETRLIDRPTVETVDGG